ncbi:MAG: DUF6475 domain-containing protein [bacterium]
MTKKDLKRFIELMGILAEAFSQEVSKEKIQIYFVALQDLSIDDIEQAVWRLVNTRTTATFPKVAEIRQAVKGKEEEKSLQAWTKVYEMMGNTGGWQSVIFDDPIIHKVIENMAGSWFRFCEIKTPTSFLQKEFEKLYCFFLKMPLNEYPKILLGYFDWNNMQNGYYQEPQHCIDYHQDRKKALSVQGGTIKHIKDICEIIEI